MADGILKVGQITTSSGSGTINLGASGETITSSAVMGSGMGKVLQVVSTTDTSERTSTSTSFVTGSNTLSVNITPASTSNKVFVCVSLGSGNNTPAKHTYTTIYRDSSNLGGSQGFLTNYQGGTGEHYGGASMSITDSPNTTSQVTYQVYFKVSGGTGKINSSAGTGTITAMEIQG